MYKLILVMTISFIQLLQCTGLKQDSLSYAHQQRQKNDVLIIKLHKKNIILPAGKFSFADSVILYDPGASGQGTVDEPDARFQHPENALGVPEQKNDSGFVSLGINGTLILKFTDNLLIDEPGPDLCIFLREQQNESSLVWVSHNGNFFQYVGRINKDNPLIDLKDKISEELYQYVKIKDASQNSSSKIPDLGIDIDAVAALNCVITKTVAADILFPQGSSTLQDSSFNKLDSIEDLIKSFNSPFVIIRAYSDGRGSSNYKLLLTQEQATAVRDYFTDYGKITNTVFSIIGMGKQNPVASNDTDTGRMKNRRIEILIYPEK